MRIEVIDVREEYLVKSLCNHKEFEKIGQYGDNVEMKKVYVLRGNIDRLSNREKDGISLRNFRKGRPEYVKERV